MRAIKVALKKKAPAGPTSWTVAELGAFYTEHRSELLAHASRVLKDSIKAEEITQDALIKFMLAAPELESEDHALSYLHRTIENLCIDYFRMEGRRPNLVLLDDATAEVEATWQNDGDHATVLSAAEDAAIIRQALAMLSPAERAALVMWEMEGRSTEEIAAELGIKESAVRHTVSRARASLRKVLAELVIDEERGLTALDLLSTSYKKASAVAKKSSKVALSLLLVVTAFLGFNSMTGNEAVIAPVAQSEISSGPVAGTNNSVAQAAPKAAAVASPTSIATIATKKSDAMVSGFAVRSARTVFAGLDSAGIPTGFTVTDAAGKVGTARNSKFAPTLTDEGMVLNYTTSTVAGGPNVLIGQSITIDGSGTNYIAHASVGMNGSWSPVTLNGISQEIERLSNGQYLLSVILGVDSVTSPSFIIPINTQGYDLLAAPKAIHVRLLLNSGKTEVLAQAINVVGAGKGGN